ncbi:putative Type 2 DNA topoisomerase 6 subunit B-like protein [Dioscorea sansibarensis]
MESSRPSVARKLSQILIASAIKRCRFSGFLCRLTISVKGFYDSHPPSIQISISDTGIGSNLVEFRKLDHRTVHIPAEKWDGVLSITTTSTLSLLSF